MQLDWINIVLGFLEGIALIASPCILPILPILLAGSVTGSKTRPLGIVVGFIFIFALFTFFSRQLVLATGIDLNTVRYISYGILILLSLIMISTFLTNQFNLATQRLVNVGANSKTLNNTEGGFTSGLLFGGLIAIIWTPCAGPILAAVIVQTVAQHTSFLSFLVLMAFAMGAMVPMLVIIVFGREVLKRLHFLSAHTEMLRKIMGVIILGSVVYLWGSEWRGTTLQTVSTNQAVTGHQLVNGVPTPYLAPEIAGITAWINSPPLTTSNLKGKVVLIDFWTYSCINCLRTLPYLKAWYAKYHADGLEIIGVHAPEFDFEKDLGNVKQAVTRFGITYPVALDNKFSTWQNFHNQYWPAHYLINKEGLVVYEHFGEGEYDVTENNIRYLLNLPAMQPAAKPTVAVETLLAAQTPETYLGFSRAERFASNESLQRNITANYTYPAQLTPDHWALAGKWLVQGDHITAKSQNASIKLHFQAKKVFAVLGTENNQPVHVVIQSALGKKTLTVQGSKLYTLIEIEKGNSGLLEIISMQPGLEVYTFTFGG